VATGLKPEKPADVEAAVAWAAAERKPLEVVGGGTRRGIGRPVQSEHTLDLSALSGISLYEPEELVLTAAAGTSVDTIREALAEHGQELAFEPPDLGALLNGSDGAATIGGIVGSNLSGPRRIRSGAARDHFLGTSIVTGRGETIRTGGRVMKNVTGYDLCKLMAGSWGTLGVMTEVTLKVLPAAETAATLLVFGLEAEEATRAMAAALGSSADVSGAAHLPPAAAARSKAPRVKDAGVAVTALRVEGFAASVKARAKLLETLLAPFGEIVRLSEKPSTTLWAEIGDVRLLPVSDDMVIWRVSTTPSRGPAIVQEVSLTETADAIYDWGGGLVWISMPLMGNGNAAALRTVLGAAGGHATLYRAPQALRAAVDVFHPQPEPVAALTRRLKAAFDPHGVLNPNRMYAGV
jgi:glycolate oxidase FAD binding subunit